MKTLTRFMNPDWIFILLGEKDITVFWLSAFWEEKKKKKKKTWKKVILELFGLFIIIVIKKVENSYKIYSTLGLIINPTSIFGE